MAEDSLKNFPKLYDFKEIETKWQQFWLQHESYKWDSSQPREQNFVIDNPPPSISGQLHLGHIFSYTPVDFIARFQRMQGKNVFYSLGFDDNGLPTERLVEKKKKIRANQISRAQFTSYCQEIVQEEEEKARDLFKKLGLSVDWQQEYQTISPTVCKLSQLSFLDLVSKNQAYLSEEPIFWDCIDQTAIAHAEIEDKEFASQMNYIAFTDSKGQPLTIATTRPELLAACVAVFFHPKDARYNKYKDDYAITPLFNIQVPILPDERVDIEKGSGLVMCCTFGDMMDVGWWRKHQLPLRPIINQKGRLEFTNAIFKADDQYVQELSGLKVIEARAKILDLLNTEGLLLKQQNIMHTVKCAERSGAPLEIISTKQWFIKVVEHKEQLLAAAQAIHWHPQHMRVRIEKWIEGLSWDWCISRQRFFGVPIPVWYSKRPGEEGKIIYAKIEDLPADPTSTLPAGYEAHEVVAESDVMDTWATSSVSPQINSHAISQEFSLDYERHQKLYPADLRPQGHEIIRSWAFYTILKSYLHEKTIPWQHIMISGWCLAEDKSKMSKSKNNIIDPIQLLQEYGADVLRYWAANTKLGVDTAFSKDILNNGKRLLNKLWNASKFIAQYQNTNDIDLAADLVANENIFWTSDLWILSKLSAVIKQVTDSFTKFEYAVANEIIEHFFREDFCDNYLEIIKTRVYNQKTIDEAGQASAINTLYICLANVLRLWAPIIPHVASELAYFLFPKNSLLLNVWPQHFSYHEEAEAEGELLVAILELVRKSKAEANLSVKAEIAELQISCSKQLKRNTISDLADVTNSMNITFKPEISSNIIAENEVIGLKIGVIFKHEIR